MLISMTGFGQGEASSKEHTVSVEIRTVNHRCLDYSFKLPRMLNAPDRAMEAQIRKRLTRGRRVDAAAMREFIQGLEIPAPAKARLLDLTPASYTGCAADLARSV